MAQSPQIIKDVTDATAATAGIGAGMGVALNMVSAVVAIIVGLLSIVVLTLRLRDRWKSK